MSTSLDLTTTYAGEHAGQYISAALLSGKTLDGNHITVKPNIKFKEVIKNMSASGLVQDATCDFDPSGSVTLTERILQPSEKQVNMQLCKQDFQADWEAISMGFSAFDTLPKNFADYLIGYVASKVAENTEQFIWSEFDTKFNESGSGVVNNGSSTSLDKTNIDEEIEGVLDAVPNAIYDAEDLTLFVSPKIAKLYFQFLGAQGYQRDFTAGNKPLDYLGKPMVVCPGLSADQIVCAQKSNLYFGTGLMNDMNEVKVIDMANIDGSQNVRMIMRFTRGVQFGIGSEIVLNR